MKKISLPFSYKIKLSSFIEQGEKFKSEEWHQKIEVINENRLSIINALNELEKTINEIITYYFFGNVLYDTVNRSQFEGMILAQGWCSFNAKKNILIKILEERKSLKGKTKDEYLKLLKKVISVRNTFAHGHLIVSNKDEIIIGYHEGDPENIKLKSEFFEKFEIDFKRCYDLTREIAKDLNVGFWQKKSIDK